jgi:NADH-quinone oxidoreductase subunit L
MDEYTKSHLKEHWIMLVPLIILAIPSLLLGLFVTQQMLYDRPGFLGNSITVLPQYDVLSAMAAQFHSVTDEINHAVFTLPFWLSVLGIVCAWLTVIVLPQVRSTLQERFPWFHRILVAQYGFDWFNDVVFVKGGRRLSHFLYRVGDLKLIDEGMVEGSGRSITLLSAVLRKLHSGYLFHYVFVMIIGLLALLIWLVL